MARWVALLRGVNVGGGNKVPMADLRKLAEGFGWTNVRSYIASGNLVFDSDEGDCAATLEAGLKHAFGVTVPVLVLAAELFRGRAATCPVLESPGNQVHGYFCWTEPQIDWETYQTLRAADETLHQSGPMVWLHAPSGIGRSVLAARLDRVVKGTDFTARNRNTIQKLVDMCGEGG